MTRQIHTLEQELGVPLFARSRAGMELTEPGRLMLERARRVLAELERARAEIRPNLLVLQGIATVGLLASASELLAEQLVAAVLREHPAVRLRIVSAGPGSSSAPVLRFSVRLVGEDFLLYPPRCLNRHTGDDREGCRRRDPPRRCRRCTPPNPTNIPRPQPRPTATLAATPTMSRSGGPIPVRSTSGGGG